MTGPGYIQSVMPAEMSARTLEQSNVNDPANPGSFAKEFESIMLSMLIQQMRETLSEGGLFGSEGSDVYGGLFDFYVSKHIADAGGIGLGDAIAQYLNTELKV